MNQNFLSSNSFKVRARVSIGIVLTFTSDVSAYMVGKICGTKLIHARPFPTISPNKSWEGIIGGLFVPGLAVPLCNYFFGESFPGQPLPNLAFATSRLYSAATKATAATWTALIPCLWFYSYLTLSPFFLIFSPAANHGANLGAFDLESAFFLSKSSFFVMIKLAHHSIRKENYL